MNKLFESMTTNETSFFRNGPQLDVFRDKVLIPVLNEQRAKGQKKLRIWSAGCSSGEEPYTPVSYTHLDVYKRQSDDIAEVERLVLYYLHLYRLLMNFVSFYDFYSLRRHAMFRCV